MRFFKVFLAAFGGVIGVIGAVLGVMAIQGRFTQETIGPESVHFSQINYMVDADFELTLTAGNEEVTEKQVTLSFSTSGAITELDGTISDGTIIVPKFVTIGRPFTVKLAKRNLTIDDESFEWIKGGISTLKATSEDRLASSATAKIFVDVPVYALKLTTSDVAINVNSPFFASTTFIPAESAFKYSQDGRNGYPLEQKSVFFDSIEHNFIEMQSLTANTFGNHNATFQTKEPKAEVMLSAYAFVSAKEEERIFAEVEAVGYADVNDRAGEILARFQRPDVRGVKQDAFIEVSPLVVESFSASTLEIKTKFNEPIVVMVNKPVTQTSTHFNLAVRILASDENIELTNHYQNVGIALSVNKSGEYQPATMGEDFFVRAGKQIVKNINGKNYTFYLPNINFENLGESSFEITALKQNLVAEALVVLFDSDESDANINESSFVEGFVKNVLSVEAQGKVSNRIYWNNDFEFKTLYIQKSSSGDVYANYSFVNPEIDGAVAYIHPNNTFKTVKYFAYLVHNSEIVDEIDGTGKKVFDFINASAVPTLFNTGTGTITIYEVIDGDVLADKDELPDGYVIKVIFATVITDENQKPLLTEAGGYNIDLVSRDANNNLQTLTFDIKQVLKTLDAKFVIESDDPAFKESQNIVAVKHQQDNAFKILFNVKESEKAIFVRDFEDGKIEARFLINGQIAQGFDYSQPTFDISQNTFEISVDVRLIEFSANGSDFFEIELKYIKGDLFSGDIDIFKVLKAEFKLKDDLEPTIYENAVFEVYDGLIALLEFAGDLTDVTKNNPILVKTAFLIDETLNSNGGILYPSDNSTTLITHASIEQVKEQLYINETNYVNIVAKDKYEKPIEFEQNIWELVSSKPEFISVGANGQSLNFEKSTIGDEQVEIYIKTTNFGVGGTSLQSNQKLYFTVETRGSIVEVVTKSFDNTTTHHQNNFVRQGLTDNWSVSDIESNVFENKESFTVRVKGSVNNIVRLTVPGEENILKILYALPNDDAQGYYNIFDLVTITKFNLINNPEIYDGFIEFKYNSNNNGIQSFKISKNFGDTAELQFNVETEIGINFTVFVEIEKVIDAGVYDNYDSLDHVSQGAIDLTENGLLYYGVFAQHLIEFDISGFEGINLNSFTPLIYDIDTKTIVAVSSLIADNTVSVNVSERKITIKLYLEDTSGFVLRNLVFVLASNYTEGAYVRNMFDFSINLRFRVNPNIKVGIGERNEIESYENQILTIKASQKEIIDFISTENLEDGVLFVERRVGERQGLTINTEQSPYVKAYLTNETGTETNMSHDFVKLQDNILTITTAFNNSTTFYVAIEHRFSAFSAYKLSTYFKVVLVADIFENINAIENFVTYDGERYLQLISTENQDSLWQDDASTANAVVYKFEKLQEMFDTNGTGTSLSVKFDVQTMSNWWNVQNEAITLFSKAEARIGVLNIIVSIVSNTEIGQDGKPALIASKQFPVILLPLKAQFIIYSTNTILEGDLGPDERNYVANQDLIYSIGEIGKTGASKYRKLYEENIYDIVNDAASEIDLFVRNEKDYGINFGDPLLFTYTLLNDPESDIPSSQVASIYNNGKLKTNQIGEDTFIIVVARYKNQFDIYYRLKVKASSELKTFYPYEDVNSENENKAEYLFMDGQSTISLDFKSTFDESIPAKNQDIENIYLFDENENENSYIPVLNEKPDSRFGVFRSFEIQANQIGYEKLPLNLVSVRILSITTNNGTVGENNWNGYVEQDQQNLFRYVFKYSSEKYTVVFEVQNNLFAKATYTVVVEPTSPNYKLVIDNGGGDFSSMPTLPENHKFVIEAPVFGEEATINTAENAPNLDNLLLIATSGFQNKTNELKFHIFDEDEKGIIFIRDNKLYANYTPNTVKAKIMFYTKYKVVAVYDIEVQSQIYVAEKDDAEATAISSLSVFAGSVFDFKNKIKFALKNGGEEEIFATSWQIDFKNLPAGQETPSFVARDESINSKLYLLPIQENSVSVQMTVYVEFGNDLGTYKFDFELIINKNIESKAINSSVAVDHEQEIYAGENIEIEMFGDESVKSLFKDIANKLETEKVGNNIAVKNLEDNYFEYEFSLTATNSASSVNLENITVNNNALIIPTAPIAYETTIILKAVLTFSKDIEGTIYILSFEAYYMFKLLPDSEVFVNYPMDYNSEKIVSTADTDIKLNVNSLLLPESKPRIEIRNKDGEIVQPGDSNFDVKVKLRVLAGERTRLTLSDGTSVDGNEREYDFDDNFAFTIGSGGLSYSEIAFDVYVNGIMRQTYKLDVYKDITSVYGVQINHINQVEDGKEVFYLGEDRTEIFAGVQEIKFLVDTNFRKNLTLQIWKNTGQSSNKYLDMSINLAPIDANFVKTVKITHETDINDVLDLTTENIRFRYSEDGINWSSVKTLSNLTIGTDNTPVIFAIASSGEPNIQLTRRIEATYLGQVINNENFLNKIQFMENTPHTYEEFKIDSTGLLGENLSRSGEVGIYFKNTTNENNSLGTFAYKYKVNFEVGVNEYEIEVGDEVRKVLDTFEIKKVTGEKFVTYNGDIPTSFAEVIESGRVSINFYFQKDGNENVVFTDAVTDEPYNILGGGVLPITMDERKIIAKDIKYDFILIAHGANNNGVKVVGVFEYKYNDPSGDPQKDIIFTKSISIVIKPVWEVHTNNRYTIGANSAQNPEIITSNLFEDNIMSYIFVDTRISGDNKGIVIRKMYGTDTKNYAIDFNNYSVNIEAAAFSDGVELLQSGGAVVAKIIKLKQPTFQEVNPLKLTIKDNYGFKVDFYFKINPESVIEYQTGLDGEIFEGDSFRIKYGSDDGSEIDHEIYLSNETLNPNDVSVKFTLYENSSKDEIIVLTKNENNDNFESLNALINFAFLDSEWFSEALNHVQAYMMIELKLKVGNSFETYTINTSPFYLNQRYVTNIGLNKIRDNVDINLINHIEIKDQKYKTQLGVPYLINDQTLIISDTNFVGTIKVTGVHKNTNEHKSMTIEIKQSENTKYISLEKYFSKDISNILNYDFIITSISEQDLTLTLTSTQLIANNIEGSYLIRLSNNIEIKDVLISEGSSTIQLETFTNNNFGIIGYEKYNQDSSFMVNLVENQNKQEVVLNFPSISSVSNFEIDLTNVGGTDSKNTKIIRLVGTDKNNTFEMKVYDKNMQQLYLFESLELQGVTDEKTIALEFNYDDLNYNFTENGEQWIITDYRYKVDGSNNNFVDNVKFSSIIDKKLSIVTVVAGPGEFVTVHFNGTENRKFNVYLNQNGKQEFSVFEIAINSGWNIKENFDASSFALRQNPIDINELALIKGITYFDDTLQFKMGPVSGSGYVQFRLHKKFADGTEIYKNFEIEVSSYAKTYTVGLSHIFRDIDKKATAVGDEFYLELRSVPVTAQLGSFEIIWPNASENSSISIDFEDSISNINTYLMLPENKYTVNQLAKIESGETRIKIDSKELYERYISTKLVPLYQYYLIEFKEAIHYVSPIEFKISPYYFGVDTSLVYESTSPVRLISNYTQYTPENSENLAYIVKEEIWASNIPFIDPYGNFINDGIEVIHLLQALNESNPIVKVTVDSDYESGSGKLIDNDLIIEISKNGSIETMHLSLNVLVALNGDSNTNQWLKIGEIKFVFNAHNQFFLEPKDEFGNNIGYVVSTETERRNGNETYIEAYVKYLEIDADEPTTFSVSKLFQDESISINDVSTINSKGQGLKDVYLSNKEESDYMISYNLNGITINKVLQSEVFSSSGKQMPVIIGSNIGNESVAFTLKIDGQTYDGTFNNSSARLFGEIDLENIIDNNNTNQNFKNLILGASGEIQSLTSSSNKVKVYWSKININSITTTLNLEFFGNGTNSEVGKEILGTISSSPMFKITQIGGSTIQEIKVNVAPKEADQNSNVEYYAITQIMFGGSVVSQAQTIVYKVENTTNLQSTETISLYGMGNDYDVYTTVVLVEKLDAESLGLKGPALFNAGSDGNPAYYEYSVGTLNVDNTSKEFEEKMKVYKLGGGADVKVDDISYTFVLDGIIRTIYESDIGTTKHASIIVNKLASTNSSGNNYTVTTNFDADGKIYNLITYTRQNNKPAYTYELVKGQRQQMTFEYDKETRFIIEADNQAELAWHELKASHNHLPNGEIYFNFTSNGNTETRKVSEDNISNEHNISNNDFDDGDIISDVWNGLLEIENISEMEYAKVTYTDNNNEDHLMYYIVEKFKEYGNFINFAKMFKDFDNGNIDKTRLKDFSEHTKISENFTLTTNVYKVEYQNEEYSLVKITDDNSSTISIFDLIKAKADEDMIAKILFEDVNVSPYSTSDWKLSEGGNYAFEQGDRFKIVETSNGNSYDLFKIFSTDILSISDGNVTISKLKLQLVIETNLKETSTVNIELVQGTNSLKLYDVNVSSETGFNAIIDISSSVSVMKAFLESLTSKFVTIYEIDNVGNRVQNTVLTGKLVDVDLIDSAKIEDYDIFGTLL